MATKRTPILVRLHRKIRMPDGPGGCWEWTGTRPQKGYGQISWGERMVATHRLAYRLYVGEIPDDLQIDHLCANTSCCNPGHLEAVTLAENMRRKRQDMTHCKAGHPFDEANTYINPYNGQRVCRECRRRHKRDWRRRQKANH